MAEGRVRPGRTATAPLATPNRRGRPGHDLESLLRAITDPSRDPVTRFLPARLVVRDSTAAPCR